MAEKRMSPELRAEIENTVSKIDLRAPSHSAYTWAVAWMRALLDDLSAVEQENRTLREGLEAAKVIADSCFEGHDWHGLQDLIEAINDGIRDTLARAGGGADA